MGAKAMEEGDVGRYGEIWGDMGRYGRFYTHQVGGDGSGQEAADEEHQRQVSAEPAAVHV